jgi:hypothetical protein
MRADIVAGAVFPDYDLTDHTGNRRKLSDLHCSRESTSLDSFVNSNSRRWRRDQNKMA